MSLSNSFLLLRRIPKNLPLRAMYSSGKDGEAGSAGSIRSGGGSFAKREQAQEDQYFRKLQQDQLKNLKSHLDEEVEHHEAEIKRHQERIKSLKEKAKNLDSSK